MGEVQIEVKKRKAQARLSISTKVTMSTIKRIRGRTAGKRPEDDAKDENEYQKVNFDE